METLFLLESFHANNGSQSQLIMENGRYKEGFISLTSGKERTAVDLACFYEEALY